MVSNNNQDPLVDPSKLLRRNPVSTCPRVAVGVGAFWPGNDASGPNKSLSNLCIALANEFDFKVLARSVPFSGHPKGKPLPDRPSTRNFEIVHLEPSNLGLRGLIAHIRHLKCDLLILNGFFDRDITLPALFARRFGLLEGPKILVAPRGEFLTGALSLKPTRKRLWIAISKSLGLVRNLAFHATSEGEAQSIRSLFGRDALIWVAPNIAGPVGSVAPRHTSPSDELRIAFVGRLTAVKNLDFAIEALRHVRARVHFLIVGPAQDAEYTHLCKERVQLLPANVTAEFLGEVPADEIKPILATLDLMFLPSKSENFGHAISEALCSGVPCLIGNETPWKNLESMRAGWDLPLSDPAAFSAIIDRYANFDANEREQWRLGAMQAAEIAYRASDAVSLTRLMLHGLVRR